jgi:hypothetical protein
VLRFYQRLRAPTDGGIGDLAQPRGHPSQVDQSHDARLDGIACDRDGDPEVGQTEDRDGSLPGNAIREDQNAWIRNDRPATARPAGADDHECDRPVDRQLVLVPEDGTDMRIVYFDLSSRRSGCLP